MSQRRLAVVIGAGVLMLLTRSTFASEPTYSLGVAPLTQVEPRDTTPATADGADRSGFLGRFFRAYYESFNPPPTVGIEPEPPRRALSAPFDSPPFPSAEYQGYPLVGVPYSTPPSPLMKALTGTPAGRRAGRPASAGA